MRFCAKRLGDGTYCPYECAPRKRSCKWHWLMRQGAQERADDAMKRKMSWTGSRRNRVPKEEWPRGERWCAGCQSYVPLFYCTGSRCKGCAASAAHARNMEDTYGISEETYAALLEYQDGKCYVCKRTPRKKRLAVDHNHSTGRVRGLLCADSERGCNHSVLGPLETAPGGPEAAARRLVAYLEDPPFEILVRLNRVNDQASKEVPPAPF